jgi:hypothetical protein
MPEKIEIEVSEYPWMPEDWAFSQMGVAFELSEDRIDQLTPEERNYWAAFATAVGSLMVAPEVDDAPPELLGTDALRSLDRIARASSMPTHVLQELGLLVKAKRADRVFPYFGPTTPEFRFGSAIADLQEKNPELFS